VQAVAAEIHPQPGNLEAAGIATHHTFALDRGHIEAAAPRKLKGSAESRGPGADYHKRCLIHARLLSSKRKIPFNRPSSFAC
jgi:hypothetical protein